MPATFAADTEAPAITGAIPFPDSEVTNLTQVTVIFGESVQGVLAEDLLINGVPATNVAGSGTTYTFRFTEPAAGFVDVSWRGSHGITDLAFNRFDQLGYGSCWSYLLRDVVPPTVKTINPLPGATVGRLTALAVTFSEPVVGVTAADLLINGQPASDVSGSNAGPYTFSFAEPAPGNVSISWGVNHGIADSSPQVIPLNGPSWTYLFRPGEFIGDVIINEFLASNISTNGLADEDGEQQDWIEVLNRGASPVNLNGWSLTDSEEVPDLWVFPAVILAPGQHLVVFASGKDRRTVPGNLHTNFRLGRAGQYLALFNANMPRQATTQFLPGFPLQKPDVSYALFGDSFYYSTNPTPGSLNLGRASFNGFASEPVPSVDSGFFNVGFLLNLYTPTIGATIRYTLDGSEPTSTSGQIYGGPIMIDASSGRAVVNVRAAAFKGDLMPSETTTRSYIFLSQVLLQPTNPPSVPSLWTTYNGAVNVPADYEMDPQILTNASHNAMAIQALTNIPTLSVVMNSEDLFSSTRGIYANPDPPVALQDAWDRSASIELILPDGSKGFQIDAGISIHGCSSRSPNITRKHSFKLDFDGDHAGSLNYAVFPDSAVGSFSTLILGAGNNLTFHNRTDLLGSKAQYVRDQFCNDLQQGMGSPSVHSRYVNLFLNGLYWGLYCLRERPDKDFGAAHLGGSAEQYDVLRNSCSGIELVDGDLAAWSAMTNLVNGSLAQNAKYEQIRQYLDIDKFIDYMIVNFYAGNTDWAMHNWYAMRKRVPGAGFHFISWDAEFTLINTNDDVISLNNGAGSPTHIDYFLRNNAEYRLRFADRVHRHFFNGGILHVDASSPAFDPSHPERNRPAALYMKRIAEVSLPILLESARWGDSVQYRDNNPNPPFSRDIEWLAELRRLTNSYFPVRSAWTVDRLRQSSLYPYWLPYGVPAPQFNRHGGNVSGGFNLTMSAPTGMVYYTTSGADPRIPGTGAISPDARPFTGAPVVLSNTVVVKARALNGSSWSPIVEATFYVAQITTPLRITELMYRPGGGDGYEFVELQNLGSTPLNLGGYSFEGITFVFPNGTMIAPGAMLVLASGQNTNGFATRYPGVVVAGYYDGKLSNNGEEIAILDIAGRSVVSVNYGVNLPWPDTRNGSSIECMDPLGDPDDPANWRASTAPFGSPGSSTTSLPPGTVVLNEVMAVGSLGEGTPDWIELANLGSSPMDLGGWSLTDNGLPRKFVFPAGTLIEARGFLVVFCDADTDQPGLHSGFELDRDGETLTLYGPELNRADCVTYGSQVEGLSVGRFGSGWQLASPTPSAPNQAASTGQAESLVINEWMANSLPGQTDWIELFNTSTQPVDLRGLYLSTSDWPFEINSMSFVGPREFVRIYAGEEQGTVHVHFKLPASGGSIILYNAMAEEINRVTYGPQLEGMSQGRLPDGAVSIVSFPGTASPGAPNYINNYTGPRLNEIMALNSGSVVDPLGGVADWVEIHNPNSGEFDLFGMSLSVGSADAGQWPFPPGTIIPGNGFLLVWCDGMRQATATAGAWLNTGRSLASESGGVYLFNSSGQMVDYLEYGFQLPNKTIGRIGTQWLLLDSPTPATVNALPAALGSPALVRFNEWMTGTPDGDDWFELYNLGSLPADLGGLYLTDDPTLLGATKHRVTPLSFIPPRGWVKWVADSAPDAGRNHVNFKLHSSGEALRLRGADMALIDSLDLGPQLPGVAQGRLPDGATNLVLFPVSSSPGEGNYLPLTNVVINEILTLPSSVREQAIELLSLANVTLPIGGWYLSDCQSEPKKFRIPTNTTLAPNGFRVFYENQFNPTPGVLPSFSMNGACGGELHLYEADLAGQLTGRRTSVKFGAAETGVSFGRIFISSGPIFTALKQTTFGADWAGSVAQFRAGTGQHNAKARIGPIVINEIMYQPVSATGNGLEEDQLDEFVELLNVTTEDVPLYDPAFPEHTWRLRDGVNYSFPPNTVIPSFGYLLVVNFDPVNEPWVMAAFCEKYGLPTSTPMVGPFNGRLKNEGETLELIKPGSLVITGSCAGLIPGIIMDRASYRPTAPWPAAAAGGGASLQRRIPVKHGEDSVAWKAEPATTARVNIHVGSPPPVITLQPSDVIAPVGGTVIFSAEATDAGLVTYQWRQNGLPLSGATNATLILTNVQLASGGFYQAWIEGDGGTIATRAALLTVVEPPVITSQPRCITNHAGATVQFSVTATGTAPIQFQWFRNGQPLLNATNPVLTLTSVGAYSVGGYHVVIANPGGSTTSHVATLTIAALDCDNDGMPDSWEQAHGLNPLNPVDADLDSDGDGMRNRDEFTAGTDPTDPQSLLKLESSPTSPTSGRIGFRFIAAPGYSYTVQVRETLQSGWTKVLDVPAEATAREVRFDAPSSGGAKFFRIVTPIQP